MDAWEAWVISPVNTERNKGLVGRTLSDIADLRGCEPAEAELQLIDEEEDAVAAVVHNRLESDVRFFMGHPSGHDRL